MYKAVQQTHCRFFALSGSSPSTLTSRHWMQKMPKHPKMCGWAQNGFLLPWAMLPRENCVIVAPPSGQKLGSARGDVFLLYWICQHKSVIVSSLFFTIVNKN